MIVFITILFNCTFCTFSSAALGSMSETKSYEWCIYVYLINELNAFIYYWHQRFKLCWFVMQMEWMNIGVLCVTPSCLCFFFAGSLVDWRCVIFISWLQACTLRATHIRSYNVDDSFHGYSLRMCTRFMTFGFFLCEQIFVYDAWMINAIYRSR